MKDINDVGRICHGLRSGTVHNHHYHTNAESRSRCYRKRSLTLKEGYGTGYQSGGVLSEAKKVSEFSASICLPPTLIVPLPNVWSRASKLSWKASSSGLRRLLRRGVQRHATSEGCRMWCRVFRYNFTEPSMLASTRQMTPCRIQYSSNPHKQQDWSRKTRSTILS